MLFSLHVSVDNFDTIDFLACYLFKFGGYTTEGPWQFRRVQSVAIVSDREKDSDDLSVKYGWYVYKIIVFVLGSFRHAFF